MWRWAALFGLALVGAAGAMALFVSPPRLLSIADAALGGGAGTERVASAVAFGMHGQTLDVWRPKGGGADLPVMIFWYGGGWVKGDRGAYAFAARAFARAGYVVVMPDYRKVPGVRFPAFVQDGAAAVKWTRDHVRDYGGDPGRIALAGHSAGAYTVAMLALDKKWLEAEGVDPAIVRAGIGLSGPYDFYPWTSDRAREAMKGADPQATQPIAFVRADAPPLLLVTSSGDTVVRPRNAISLSRRLREAGAPVTMKTYESLTHEDVVVALSKPFRGKAPVLADSLAFLEKALATDGV